MKRIRKLQLVFIMLVAFSAVSYAAIGNNNFLIGIGGGYSRSQIYGGRDELPSDFYVEVPGYELNAGSIRLELGVPLHFTPHKNNFVHALDIRANFTASFAEGTALDTSAGEIKQKINSFGGGAQAVYGIGVAFGKDKVTGAKLIFDLLGYGVGIGSSYAERTLTYTDISKSSRTLKDNKIHTKMEVIVPGIHYFDSSGFTIGLRNTFQFTQYIDLDEDSSMDYPDFAFTTYAYIGYTFNTTRGK